MCWGWKLPGAAGVRSSAAVASLFDWLAALSDSPVH